MNTELIVKQLRFLDKELFPDDTAPVSVGETKNGALVQYEFSPFFGLFIEGYKVSDQIQQKPEDGVSELQIVVHEIRHRVQNRLLQKNFAEWSRFKVKTTQNAPESAIKLADMLLKAQDLHELDALMVGRMAEPLQNNLEGHLKEIKNILMTPLKSTVNKLKDKGIILKKHGFLLTRYFYRSPKEGRIRIKC